jgi:GAF domain-containing protein
MLEACGDVRRLASAGVDLEVIMSVELPLAEEIAAVFARATRLLLTEETVAHALKLITEAASVAVPGARGAGLSLIGSSGERQTAAASDDVVAAADALQYELGEGPCITAWAGGETVLMTDLALETRWPRWVAAATALGISSSISSPLLSRGAPLGAIKIYFDRAGPFDPETVHLVNLFAEQATLFVIHSLAREAALTLSDRLQDSLAQRDTISMAKGLLMATNGGTEDEALRSLMALSRGAEKPLVQVAGDLLAAANPAEL